MRLRALTMHLPFISVAVLAAYVAQSTFEFANASDVRRDSPAWDREMLAIAERGNTVAVSERNVGAIFEEAMRVSERADLASRCGDHAASLGYMTAARKMLTPLADPLRRQAEQGDAESQYMLGYIHDHRVIGPAKDYTEARREARKWYRKAADQGHAKAQMWLGYDYYLEKDYVEAINLFRKAAELELTDAQSQLGVMYYRGEGVARDDAEAARWLRRAAQQGHAHAQRILAVMYDDGVGVKQDHAEAVNWYRKSAAQGDIGSHNSLGEAYARGRGAPQDHGAAAHWFRAAAEAGNIWAQFNLGLLYYGGQGVPQDYVEAHKWFNLAASRLPSGTGQDRDARDLYAAHASLRDQLAERMTPDQIAEAQRLAREWKPTKQRVPGCGTQ